MQCPKCRAENPEGKKYCRECGGDLVHLCPQCGAEVFPGDKFCGDCRYDLRESKEAPRIDFTTPQSYTPKHLADKILTTRSSIEGERKLVTVLFADVAGYTAMSEKLDPEEVHQLMDGCFKVLMDENHRYEGTINQFTGDGVMALFGAPVAHEDHAQRACHAALAIQRAMGIYGEKLRADHGIDFRMRIGLNSGPVIVGAIGDDLRMDYTAVGDTTNVASRMQGLARPGSVLVSQATYRIARDYFAFEPLGQVEVKGKERPLEAFELIEPSAVETRIEASAARGLTRFVGRRNSMAALMAAYDKARAGAGQVAGIVGEAGVGKSRLLLELRSRISGDGSTYLEGRCLQYGGSIIYLPVLDILRSFFEIQEGDREFVIKKKMGDKISQLDEALTGALSPLQEILSLKVEDEAFLALEPKEKRERIFEAVRDILIRESQERPLVVAVEDLHWIDRSSEEFLGYLIEWLAQARILLILLYRPEYSHQWGSKSFYNRVWLDQLTAESSARLVQAILEGGEVAPELRELILERAAGNPLFMEEFTHTLLENGSILKKNHQYVLSRSLSEIEVPDTIQGIISARMDRLEENLKRIMQVASVIGRDFAFRILQTITGAREELKSYLLNLQGLEFIYEKRLFPELEYIFKHALIQEVAYNSLLLKRRTEIHAKIGRAIEQIYAERLEEFYEMLAYHYAKSEVLEAAQKYLRLSGEKALKNFSTETAFGFFKEALKAADKMPETEKTKRDKLAIIQAMTVPMRHLSYPAGSLEILEQGEKLAEELQDERLKTILYSRIGNYHTIKSGNPVLGLQYNERSFGIAEKLDDLELMARTGWDLIASLSIIGQEWRLPGVCSRLIELMENTQKEGESFGTGISLYAAFHGYQGMALGMTGCFEAGRKIIEKGIEFASRRNSKSTLALLEWLNGWPYLTQGNGRETILQFQRALKYIEEVKYVLMLGICKVGLGCGHYFIGDLETAKTHMEEGLRIQKEKGSFYLSFIYVYLAAVHFSQGAYEKAQDLAKEALRLAKENMERHNEGLASIWLGRILGKCGEDRLIESQQIILEAIGILGELKRRPYCAQGYLFLGESYLDSGECDKGIRNVRKAEKMFREMGMDYWLNKAQEVLGIC